MTAIKIDINGTEVLFDELEVMEHSKKFEQDFDLSTRQEDFPLFQTFGDVGKVFSITFRVCSTLTEDKIEQLYDAKDTMNVYYKFAYDETAYVECMLFPNSAIRYTYGLGVSTEQNYTLLFLEV